MLIMWLTYSRNAEMILPCPLIHVLPTSKNMLARPLRTLLHVAKSYGSDHESEAPTKSYDEVCKLFHTMSKVNGLKGTYKTFQSKDFRESLYIPQAIWDEIKPSLQDEVIKAKARAKEKQA